MAASWRVFVPLNLVPLQHAVLCANCEVISDSKNGHCLACGSPSLVNLARVLDGVNRPGERARTHPARPRARAAAACRSGAQR